MGGEDYSISLFVLIILYSFYLEYDSTLLTLPFLYHSSYLYFKHYNISIRAGQKLSSLWPTSWDKHKPITLVNCSILAKKDITAL